MSVLSMYTTNLEAISKYKLVSREEEKRFSQIMKGTYFCNYLLNNGIDYELLIKHPLSSSCVDSKVYYERYRHYLNQDYVICKHLLLKEKKGSNFYLLVVNSLKKVDLSLLREQINSKKLEFATTEEMNELLSTNPGNISIFNLISDVNNKANLIIDKNIIDSDLFAFHPLYNEMSVFISKESMLNFLSLIDRKATYLDVPAKSEEKVKVLEKL